MSRFLRVKRFHFVGIGGAGMSGIARILHSMGFTVTGSDAKEGAMLGELRALGVPVSIGHAPGNLPEKLDVVIRSTAVRDSNPEIIESQRRGVPVVGRGEMLAEITRLGQTVAVAGTHGKTTTSSLLGSVLARAGLSPTVIVGGRVRDFGSNVLVGAQALFVVESDESDGSFLNLTPSFAVVTNIDSDHLEYYGTMERLRGAFAEFMNRVPFFGLVVACGDDPNIRKMRGEVRRKVVTYGFSDSVDVRAIDADLQGGGARFRVVHFGKDIGLFQLKLSGRHNILNSLAVLTVALELDAPIDAVRAALASFSGVARRLELRGEAGKIRVYDDYGHHPTEIRATLEAAKYVHPDGRLLVLFQPHRYTRTRALVDEFGAAFGLADRVFVTDIYAAGEDPINGLTGQTLVDSVHRQGGRNAEYVRGAAQGIERVLADARPGDIVLTLGAGDIDQASGRIVSELEKKYG